MILTNSFYKIADLEGRIRIVQGGSSASKTFSILQKLILLAFEINEHKLISIVTDTHPNITKGAFRDFVSMIGDIKVKVTKVPLEVKINKITYEFFGLDDETKARGGRRDILFINEANRIKWETARQLIMRTRDVVYIDYNPDAEFWAHENYINKPESSFVIVTYKDNQCCPQAAIDEIEKYKEIDKEWYKVYGLGQVGNLYAGKIFPIWEQIETFPEIDGFWYGLDFGFSSDPTAIVKVLPVNDRLYVDEVLYRTELVNAEIANILKMQGYNGEAVICDSAEPKSIQELRLLGINAIPADKGKGSINEGIDFLKSQKILVTQRSMNLMKENKHYKWKQDKDGRFLKQPVDAHNHLIDALRYAFSLDRHRRNTAKTTTIKY